MSFFRSSKVKPPSSEIDDEDDWQAMPVVQSGSSSQLTSIHDDLDEEEKKRYHWRPSSPQSNSKQKSRHASSSSSKTAQSNSTSGFAKWSGNNSKSNATGRHLNVDDARGYDWRVAPSSLGMGMSHSNDDSDDSDEGGGRSGAKNGKNRKVDDSFDDDDEKGRGYTQLRLDEDEESEAIHAATSYLFGDGPSSKSNGAGPTDEGVGATPLSQMATTKQLLSEGQKIAYVGICSLLAKELVRKLKRVPGKETGQATKSAEEWLVRVMARLYQHMDIEASEQQMIDSLAQHGVLSADLAPSLITTQTVNNPDFDPEAKKEREEEELAEKERAEERKKEEEELERIERDRIESRKRAGAQEDVKGNDHSDSDPASPPAPVYSSTADFESRESSPRASETKEVAELDQVVGEEEEEEEEEEDGDIASVPRASQSSNRTSKRQSQLSKASKASVDSGASPTKEDDGLEGDIGGLARASTPQPKNGSTAVPSSSSSPSQLTDKSLTARPTTTLADPNTAAQTGLEAAAGMAQEMGLETKGAEQSSNTTTVLGLSSQPQKVEPPPSALEGVTTEISSADEKITLDLRWTILCDLFLVLTADSVYDARSRVLLLSVAEALGLTWMDVTTFEKRVTDALEIEEGVESLKDKSAAEKRAVLARRRRMLMVGAATVGGGLVIGLSAGLLAPLIGAGLGATLGAVGIGGTSSFLGGVGGAAIITSTATLGGATIGGKSMSRRTRNVKTFEFRPLHNNKRVNAIVTVPGFMNGPQDDPRLPFSVLDSIVGDVFSVLWEPDMMMEMGNALSILWNETFAMGVQTVLSATIAGGLFGALAWPLWLTKLGYLIDNPWSNALDRAHSAGLILADILSKRQLGVRPITLIGFSLGARVIFYALLELARVGAFGVVQDVFLMGAPVSAKDSQWKEARSVVAGRFVNAFSRTDWILGYLHRATSGGLGSIAGLHPVDRVPDIENVEVTHAVPGHLQYRALMPLVLDELGFRCTADYFDEPEDMSKIPEREVIREHKDYELRTVQTKSGGFGKIWKKKNPESASNSESGSRSGSRPGTANAAPTPSSSSSLKAGEYDEYDDDDLPPRMESPHASAPPARATSLAVESTTEVQRSQTPEIQKAPSMAVHFDTETILAELRESGIEVKELESSLPPLVATTTTTTPTPTPQIPHQTPSSSQSLERRRSDDSASSARAEDSNQSASSSRPSKPSRSSSATSRQLGYLDTPTPHTPSSYSNASSGYSYTEPTRSGAGDGSEGVSLSFASYDDDDIEIPTKSEESVPNSSLPVSHPISPVSERYASYGLSTQTADQLAREFSGRASAGQVSSVDDFSLATPPLTFPPSGGDGWSEDTFVSRGGLPGEMTRKKVEDQVEDERPTLNQPQPTLSFGGLSNSLGTENPWD